MENENDKAEKLLIIYGMAIDKLIFDECEKLLEEKKDGEEEEDRVRG